MSLTPTQEQEVFAQWAYDTAEPTLQNPPDLERERNEFYKVSKHAKNFAGSSYQIAIAKKMREFSACRLLRFDTLPDDIILHIFRQGVFFSRENRQASLMPLVYSKVCQRWRALAFEASWLWSFIIFPDDHAPYSLTRVYLERSRLAPLVIELNITNSRFDPEGDQSFWPTEDHLQERMSLFLPHAHRWSSFACYTDNWAPLSHVVNKISTLEFPFLTDLTLVQYFSEPDDSPLPTPLPLTMGVPRLDRLYLIGLTLDWKYLSELRLNLSDFSFHSIPDPKPFPSVEDFYGILNTSTNLRKLALVGFSFDWDPVEAPPRILQPILLPHIEEFSFEAEPSIVYAPDMLRYLAYLLTFFNFGPNLLSVSLSPRFQDPEIDRFVPILASKFGRIENFCIGYTSFTLNQLASWLDVLPNLTSISILCPNIQPIVCAVLSQKFDHLATPILCPRLHTLFPCIPDDGLVPRVLTARLGMGHPFRHIVWDINDRETVERSPHYQFLKRIVSMSYEGDIVDPKDVWVGSGLEFAVMGVLE